MEIFLSNGNIFLSNFATFRQPYRCEARENMQSVPSATKHVTGAKAAKRVTSAQRDKTSATKHVTGAKAAKRVTSAKSGKR